MPKKIIKELTYRQVRNSCSVSSLGFSSTKELGETKVVIKQDRALKAIELGLNVEGQGFNIYVCGYPGTGRNTTIFKEIKKIAHCRKSPQDVCYIYNFENASEPKVLKLPAGYGLKLKTSMEEFIIELQAEIQKAFSSKEYEEKKNEVVSAINKEKEEHSAELENYARQHGFTIQQSLTGLLVLPVKNGKPMTEKDLELLDAERKRELEEEQKNIYKKIYEFSNKIRDIQKQLKNKISALDKQIALFTIGHLIDDLKKAFKDNKKVQEHLDNILKDILSNLDIFKKTEKQDPQAILPDSQSKEQILARYNVNLIVDNSDTKGAPVIREDNPTYANLTGQVEQKVHYGVLVTDFNMIKAGTIHYANNGYLVLQAEDILKNYYAWDALKRVIKYGNLKIESVYEKYGLNVTTTLKPEPVNINLKVVLIGSPYIYQLLYVYDSDFRKLFKIKAEFDTSLQKTTREVKKYALFIASKIHSDKLLHFKAAAVAKLIDYSSRLASDKSKLSAQFVKITDLMKEADYWAKKDNKKIVTEKHIDQALKYKMYRSSLIEDKLTEMVVNETILVDVKGQEVGQINGLSILDMGDYIFGKPSRITARTYAGSGRVVNIEREADMSGNIHSKGVLILSSYLADRFGQDKALSFSASICFEQLYSGVDGDSASSTELYCILSSLAELPINQEIAVTGSINQKGEVQAIGGVNQKIEGFFTVCKLKGLTGSQGVMIPYSNVKNLMLNDEVTESVKKGKFHIYPVKNVSQGIEILTGHKYGRRLKSGAFTKDSISDIINKKLKSFNEIIKKEEKSKKGKV